MRNPTIRIVLRHMRLGQIARSTTLRAHPTSLTTRQRINRPRFQLTGLLTFNVNRASHHTTTDKILRHSTHRISQPSTMRLRLRRRAVQTIPTAAVDHRSMPARQQTRSMATSSRNQAPTGRLHPIQHSRALGRAIDLIPESRKIGTTPRIRPSDPLSMDGPRRASNRRSHRRTYPTDKLRMELPFRLRSRALVPDGRCLSRQTHQSELNGHLRGEQTP